METEYLPSFIKDLKSLKSTQSYASIKKLAFETISNCTQLAELRNVKQLKASDNAYRIRIGDYRMGFFLEGDTIVIARVLHRSKIYQVFP